MYFEVQNKVQFFGKRMEGLAFRCMFFHKSLGGSNFARIKKKQIFGLEFLDKCFVDSRANVFWGGLGRGLAGIFNWGYCCTSNSLLARNNSGLSGVALPAARRLSNGFVSGVTDRFTYLRYFFFAVHFVGNESTKCTRRKVAIASLTAWSGYLSRSNEHDWFPNRFQACVFLLGRRHVSLCERTRVLVSAVNRVIAWFWW